MCVMRLVTLLMIHDPEMNLQAAQDGLQGCQFMANKTAEIVCLVQVHPLPFLQPVHLLQKKLLQKNFIHSQNQHASLLVGRVAMGCLDMQAWMSVIQVVSHTH